MGLPLEKYAIIYKDDLIGNIVIAHEDDALSILFVKSPHLDTDLTHFHGDLFRANYKSKGRGEGPFFSFLMNPDFTIREA